jgi:hypothetical protein
LERADRPPRWRETLRETSALLFQVDQFGTNVALLVPVDVGSDLTLRALRVEVGPHWDARGRDVFEPVSVEIADDQACDARTRLNGRFALVAPTRAREERSARSRRVE